jgi:aldose 1-epimerase
MKCKALKMPPTLSYIEEAFAPRDPHPPFMKGRPAMSLRCSTMVFWSVLLTLSFISCTGKKPENPTMEKQLFGTAPDGRKVYIYTLKNSRGMEARITNFGGIVLSLLVPDRHGRLDDVVLGYDSLPPYFVNKPYFGALIGRYGNRIGKGKFTLDGTEYTLAMNNGPNHLHGGVKGFDKVVWEVKEPQSDPGRSLVLSYVSKDGEEGYPGTLKAEVTYALTDSNELRIQYRMTTDKPTVVNLTHHSYFNLAGQGEGDILNHELMINADLFTPTDAGLIPTGELRPVKGTPMDFTTPAAIGARINQPDEQLKLAGGYDHNWVLRGSGDKLAARVFEPTSGRVMEVFTSEPGLQFYSGNFLDGTDIGKGGKVYKHRYGLCLETQHFPDSPNKPDFPSTVLRPMMERTTVTVYRFSTQQ